MLKGPYLQDLAPASITVMWQLETAAPARLVVEGPGGEKVQEIAAALSAGSPEYRVTESGPDHAKTFVARAVVGDQSLGEGTGRSKKEAEQGAAEHAWVALNARRLAQESPLASPPASPA